MHTGVVDRHHQGDAVAVRPALQDDAILRSVARGAENEAGVFRVVGARERARERHALCRLDGGEVVRIHQSELIGTETGDLDRPETAAPPRPDLDIGLHRLPARGGIESKHAARVIIDAAGGAPCLRQLRLHPHE